MSLFGTDGIRGKVGERVTGDVAYRLGNALSRRADGGKIVVGRDTRDSGAMLMQYLSKGILDGGAIMVDLGIVPTPLVSYAVREAGAEYGVAITASHNDASYNGLKVFSALGGKADSETENGIEEDMTSRLFVAKSQGKCISGECYVCHYKNMLKERFSDISGLKVVFDMANGALSKVGRDVVKGVLLSSRCINSEGKGALINRGTGALYPEAVTMELDGADVGFAFDGDGDRIVAVTASGRVVNGDLILYCIARYLKRHNALDGNVVVGTPYTNMGVVQALARSGITLVRSEVGDSNVERKMRRIGAKVGAERAGHVILADYLPTGDALYIALYLLRIMVETGASLDELTSVQEYPMVSRDMVTNRAQDIASDDMLVDIVKEYNRHLGNDGRVLLRASGTEPKLRLMVECVDVERANSIVSHIVEHISSRFDITP